MKIIRLHLLVASCILLISCGGDSLEEIEQNCSESLLLVHEVSTQNADCQTLGELVVTSEGGEGDVQYSLIGFSFQSSPVFNLPAGPYTITAKDQNKCTATLSGTIGAVESSVRITSIESESTRCGFNDSQIVINAIGGEGNLLYKLDQGSFQESNIFVGVGRGLHTIRVKDEEGCEVSRSELVLSTTELTKDIMPILTSNCAISSSCHNTASSRSDLSNRNVVINLANTINSRVRSGNMPPSGEPDLSSEQIDLITCWVEDGAKNN